MSRRPPPSSRPTTRRGSPAWSSTWPAAPYSSSSRLVSSCSSRLVSSRVVSSRRERNTVMAMTAFPEGAAAAGRRQARIMRVVNVPMRAVLRLPFRTPLSGNLMLISYTGVKSGKAYRQPVSYARDGETLLTPGGGRWTLNLKNGRPVRLRLRGRDVAARADLVSDPDEVERLLGVIGAGNPRALRYIPIPRRADGRLDPDAL